MNRCVFPIHSEVQINLDAQLAIQLLYFAIRTMFVLICGDKHIMLVLHCIFYAARLNLYPSAGHVGGPTSQQAGVNLYNFCNLIYICPRNIVRLLKQYLSTQNKRICIFFFFILPCSCSGIFMCCLRNIKGNRPGAREQ